MVVGRLVRTFPSKNSSSRLFVPTHGGQVIGSDHCELLTFQHGYDTLKVEKGRFEAAEELSKENNGTQGAVCILAVRKP